jgi:phosphoribosylamine--glycine ligase
MRAEGREYRGFLYAGLMLTCNGPRVIEFNVRLGDPEAQVVLPLVSTDLGPLLARAADGDLRNPELVEGSAAMVGMTSEVAVGVVLASAGYPGPVRSGYPIHGLEDAEALEDHCAAGRNRDAGHDIVTAGGRVLTVVGRAQRSTPRSHEPTKACRNLVRRHAIPTGHRAQGDSGLPRLPKTRNCQKLNLAKFWQFWQSWQLWQSICPKSPY